MRNLGLDLLRIIAVILVIGRHLHIPESGGFALQTWREGGWIGVDLFFVLSGFLVSSLLFREHIRHGEVDVKRFLIRRGFKIYPAFWVLFAFTLLMRYWFEHLPSRWQILGDVLFLQNYIGGVWGHTWSLAVEEHFYLGMALIFTVLHSRGKEKPFAWIPILFVVTATICLTFRILNLVLFPEYSHRAYLFGTHIRVDSLLFGVLLAYLCHFRNLEQRIAKVHSFVLCCIGILLLSPAFIFRLETHKWLSVIGVVMFYCGSGLCVLAALRLQHSDWTILKVLGALGASSYSIYLWHVPVATWGHRIVSKVSGIDHYYFYLFNSIVGACIVGWVLNRLIEKPALLARDKIFPSTVRAIPTRDARQEPALQ